MWLMCDPLPGESHLSSEMLLFSLSLEIVVSCLWIQYAHTLNLEVERVPTRISSREGCREVLTCVGVDSQPTWRKEPGQVGGQIINSNRIDNGSSILESSLIFKSLDKSDGGAFVCDLSGGRSLQLLMVVKSKAMFISPVSNLSLSDHVYGEDLSISCSVDTCVSDIVLQLFKDDQLLHMSMSSMGNRITGSAQVKVSDELVGEYACQVMSDSRNEVVRERFSVRGTPRRSGS